MAQTSQMIALGTSAPGFDLPTISGEQVGLDDLRDAPALLVAFLCNHCPYVRHVEAGFATLAREYRERGVAVVGICSNDADAYPDDAPDGLRAQARRAGFDFPYLVDGTQEVGRVYAAACTPDFFLFDGDQRLVYRGRMDASRPGSDTPVSGEELRAALDAVLAGEPVTDDQHPSIGCSIKWREGNAPGLPQA